MDVRIGEHWQFTILAKNTNNTTQGRKHKQNNNYIRDGNNLKALLVWCFTIWYLKRIFSSRHRGTRFQNTEFPFFNLKDKYHNDYNVLMKHLEEECGFSKVDYKLFNPNLLCNDEYIEFYQNIHKDLTIDKPI